MKHNNCYVYPPSMREVIDGKRHYAIKQEKLPSVTSYIIWLLKIQKKQLALQNWRDRVGEAEAALKITERSCSSRNSHAQNFRDDTYG